MYCVKDVLEPDAVVLKVERKYEVQNPLFPLAQSLIVCLHLLDLIPVPRNIQNTDVGWVTILNMHP